LTGTRVLPTMPGHSTDTRTIPAPAATARLSQSCRVPAFGESASLT
jgi:hypothetical protein